MLETLFCTLVAFTCITGTPEIDHEIVAAMEPVEEPTLVERLNAERARRQGREVRQHVAMLPHASTRGPVVLFDALQKQAEKSQRFERTTTRDLFEAPYRYNVHYHRIRCEKKRRAAMRYYDRLNSITMAEEALMRRAVKNGQPLVQRGARLPHVPTNPRIMSNQRFTTEAGIDAVIPALQAHAAKRQLPWLEPAPARAELH